MNNVKDNILSQAKSFFLKFGFRNVTMENLCKEMGISKKTIYQFFETKDFLVEACILDYMEKEANLIQKIRNESKDPLETFYNLSRRALESLKEVSPFVIFDLQKNHPEIWKKFVNHDFEWQYNMLIYNLKMGKQEGYYRPEINPEKVALVFLHQTEGMLRPRIFETSSMELIEAIKIRDEIFLRGICTSLGLERLEKLIQSNQNKITLK